MKWRFKKGDLVHLATDKGEPMTDSTWVVKQRIPKQRSKTRDYDTGVVVITEPYYLISQVQPSTGDVEAREYELEFQDASLTVQRPPIVENTPPYRPWEWRFAVGDHVVIRGTDDEDLISSRSTQNDSVGQEQFTWMHVTKRIPMIQIYRGIGRGEEWRWYEVAYTPRRSDKRVYYHQYPESALRPARMDLRREVYFKQSDFTAVPIVRLTDTRETLLGFKDEGPNASKYASHALLFPNGAGAYTMRGVSNPLMLVSLADDGQILAAQLMQPNVAKYESEPNAKDVVELAPALYQALGWQVGDHLVLRQGQLIKTAQTFDNSIPDASEVDYFWSIYAVRTSRNLFILQAKPDNYQLWLWDERVDDWEDYADFSPDISRDQAIRNAKGILELNGWTLIWETEHYVDSGIADYFKLAQADESRVIFDKAVVFDDMDYRLIVTKQYDEYVVELVYKDPPGVRRTARVWFYPKDEEQTDKAAIAYALRTPGLQVASTDAEQYFKLANA